MICGAASLRLAIRPTAAAALPVLCSGGRTTAKCSKVHVPVASASRHFFALQNQIAYRMVHIATPATTLEEAEEESRANFRDTFVPLSRRTLMRKLMEKEKFLSESERRLFEKFAFSLDSALALRLEGDVATLKALFDSINPDKDTADSRKYNRRERLDNEFWLLQKLSTILQHANFHELPPSPVQAALAEHRSDGVMVNALADQYDVVRFWALGREAKLKKGGRAWYEAGPLRPKYYRRVIVAIRLKTEDRLTLKAFKEVPADKLELLLPAGTLRMTQLDQMLLVASGAFGLGSGLAKVLADCFSVPAVWALPFVGLSAASAGYIWTSFKNKQQRRLVELSRTIYFKNIINNRGLLALLAGKARDETFKEALLVYAFLLGTRPPSARLASSAAATYDPVSPNIASLEHSISDWLERVTSLPIRFDATPSVRLLTTLGLLSRDASNSLHVLPLDSALRILPAADAGHNLDSPVGSRVDEYDLVEGFEVERSILEEHEYDYTLADRIRKRIGWL